MDIDLELFKNIMAEARHNDDLLDSYSPNQFKSKEILINHIRDLDIVDEKSEITILGGWYGSILIPAFKEVKKISSNTNIFIAYYLNGVRLIDNL